MKQIIIIVIVLAAFTSCKVLSPEQMLRTPRTYEYSDPEKLKEVKEYRIASNDQLSFLLLSNDGEKLVDPLEGSASSRMREYSYLIEYDGNVKLPVLGRVKLEGMTLREAEIVLEEKYSKYYNRPFVRLNITNNRVVVFPGGRGGSSRVIYLENTNTTLFEALAQAGGITDGKAHRVKLIRDGNSGKPEVYHIDLSTIAGIDDANIILQANDIIYVDPRERVPQRILENITPYASLASTILVLYSLFN